MKNFSSIRFKGSFRSYQQRVLENAGSHLSDKKLHIAAAPGSGKTILGLEMIRRLNEPALVFSPTSVIAMQWTERFREMFLPEGENIEDYISDDLSRPSLITSVTYQALHAAYSRHKEEKEHEGTKTDPHGISAPSGFSFRKMLSEHGIKTVCFDEAHHLKKEWQKALELFISESEDDVVTISLTATPPYDSTGEQWNRYISLCGYIDDEIFVPELVMHQTLCPHQDYIYFNFPSETETDFVMEFRKRSAECIAEIVFGGFIDKTVRGLAVCSEFSLMKEHLYEYTDEYRILFSLASAAGTELAPGLLKTAGAGESADRITPGDLEKLFAFIIGQPDIFGEENSLELSRILSSRNLIKNGAVQLSSDKTTEKLLMKSSGKLASISRIAASEYSGLKQGLRMLILTDYIRKDFLNTAGTDLLIDEVGAVPIFETLRRSMPGGPYIGLLSGTLVIWPDERLEMLRTIARRYGIDFSSENIAGTEYSEVDFRCGNDLKTAAVTDAFERGHVNILTGTKSLLGEGWDSPCINSLILATFVGSYVLSNQMRGRAVRSYSDDPHKTANIWHLVSIEPEDLFSGSTALSSRVFSAFRTHDQIVSSDFETLIRRFECFFAPWYNERVISNGISRIDILKPPFDRAGIQRINDEMLRRASGRLEMSRAWEECLFNTPYAEITDKIIISRAASVPKPYVYRRFADFTAHFALLGACAALYLGGLADLGPLLLPGTAAAAAAAGSSVRLFRAFSPAHRIKKLAAGLFETLRETGDITSETACADVVYNKADGTVTCALTGAFVRESRIFGQAMQEMMSPFNDPRYLFVLKKRKSYDYTQSFACPEIISNAKKVQIFEKHLRHLAGKYTAVYTRSGKNSKVLFYCRRFSWLNLTGRKPERRLQMRQS